MDIVAIANRTIPAAQGKKDFRKEGQTADIIAEVLAAFKESREQLKQFAPHLKAATLPQTLENVWRFWKYNIRYQVDPLNEQWIQTPAALWASKSGDCKSLSIAVMCTLDALGIKAAFRFATYKKENTVPTHVYVVVREGRKIIPVDCVWDYYGSEKQYSKKWDYNMTAIYRLSGFDNAPARPIALHIRAAKKSHRMPERCKCVIPEDNPNITPAVVDMLLKKQRLELEQRAHVSSSIGAIGDTYDRAYEMQIAGLHNALAADMGWPRVTVAGYENAVHPDQRNSHAVSGIACIPLQKEAETVAALEGFFGKIFKGIKNVAKKVAKVVTAPARLAFKGVKAAGKLIGKGAVALKNVAQKQLTSGARNAITEQLPQVAPMFLYLFITDPKLLAKLPAAVAAKRAKALEYKKLITGKLMMSESNFTGAVRNGIMMQFNLAPEAVIAKFIKDTNFKVSGIGLLPFLSTALGAAGGLLKKILGNVGENIGQDAETYAPAPEDWGTVSESATDLAASIQAQPTNLQPMSEGQLYNAMDRAGAYSGGGSYSPQARAANTDTAADSLPEGATDNGNGTYTAADGTIYPKNGQKFGETQQLENVDVKPTTAGGSSNNTGLLLLGGLAVLAVVAGKPKRGR